MSIPTREEYLVNERRRYAAQCREWAKVPPFELKEARADYTSLLCDPPRLVERIEWLLDGNYGEIEMIIAKEVVGNKRCNRAAQIAQMIAGLECSCPDREARAAYRALGLDQRNAVDAALAALLVHLDEEQQKKKEEGEPTEGSEDAAEDYALQNAEARWLRYEEEGE